MVLSYQFFHFLSSIFTYSIYTFFIFIKIVKTRPDQCSHRSPPPLSTDPEAPGNIPPLPPPASVPSAVRSAPRPAHPGNRFRTEYARLTGTSYSPPLPVSAPAPRSRPGHRLRRKENPPSRCIRTLSPQQRYPLPHPPGQRSPPFVSPPLPALEVHRLRPCRPVRLRRHSTA